MSRTDGFFSDLMYMLDEENKQDGEWKYLIIQGLSKVEDRNVMVAVYDISDNTLEYITEQEVKSIIGKVNLAICWENAPSRILDKKNSLTYDSGVLDIDTTEFCLNFDNVALSSLMYGKFMVICQFREFGYSSVTHSVYCEFEYSEMSDNQIAEIIGTFWENVCVKPIGKLAKGVTPSLPVKKMKVTGSIGGCTVLGFQGYLQGDDEDFCDFMCGDDSEIGYYEVIEQLESYAMKKKKGVKYVFQEDIYEDFGTIFVYSMVDLSSIFCKEFAGEYVHQLEACELDDCYGNKLKDYLIKELTERGVWEEFKKYA